MYSFLPHFSPVARTSDSVESPSTTRLSSQCVGYDVRTDKKVGHSSGQFLRPGPGYALVVSEVTTALAKSKVAWLLLPPDRTVPCWYAASGETAYIVGGDGEQPIPELPAELRITLRDKETRRAIGPVPASATRIGPDSQDWAAATTALLGARQSNPPEGLREHWAEHCTVWALRVHEELPAHHADPPQPSPVTPD